jgi:hypothetical protein
MAYLVHSQATRANEGLQIPVHGSDDAAIVDIAANVRQSNPKNLPNCHNEARQN